MRWHLETVTASTLTLVVSTCEFKDHARISTTADDTYIDTVIESAQQYVQQNIPGGRQLLATIYDLVLDGFPNDSNQRINLPRPPLSNVATVTYRNGAATTTTVASTDWVSVSPTDLQGWIEPAYSVCWPTAIEAPDAVTVRFTAGYGSTGSSTAINVPIRIRHAVKMLASHWYEMREPTISGTIIAQVPLSVEALLQSAGWGHYS